MDWQSASLPGSAVESSSDLRRVRSRAWRAAILARAAWLALLMISLASPGLRSNQSRRWSLQAFCTNDLASVLPSLVLVWPSNCGSASLTETIAVRPSRTSSPVRLSSFSRSSFCSRAYLLTIVVSAARNPSSWVPPSAVLIVLAKVCTDSVYAELHCMAISTEMPSPSSPKSMTEPCTGSLEALIYRTKSAIPPSYTYSAPRGSSWRWSVIVMARFLLRKAISCMRRNSVSKDQSVASKIWPSGQNVIVVPVSWLGAPRTSGPTGSPRA